MLFHSNQIRRCGENSGLSIQVNVGSPWSGTPSLPHYGTNLPDLVWISSKSLWLCLMCLFKTVRNINIWHKSTTLMDKWSNYCDHCCRLPLNTLRSKNVGDVRWHHEKCRMLGTSGLQPAREDMQTWGPQVYLNSYFYSPLNLSKPWYQKLKKVVSL